jgi:hypothetical protein
MEGKTGLTDITIRDLNQREIRTEPNESERMCKATKMKGQSTLWSKSPTRQSRRSESRKEG